MSDIPKTAEGTPLTELIGKEVNVKIITGRTPITRLMHCERCFEILWDIEPVSSFGDYTLRILLINRRKTPISLAGSCIGSYRIRYSNVELSQVENGAIFDVNTPKMQERLSTLILNKM